MACASCSSSSKVTRDWRSEPVAQEGWWAVYAPRSWSTGPMDLGGGLEAVAGIGLLDATEMAKFDSEGRNRGSGDASSMRMGREAGEERTVVGYREAAEEWTVVGNKDQDSSTWSMSWDDYMKKYWGYYDGGSSSGQGGGGGGTTSTGDNPSTSGSGTGTTSSDNSSDDDGDPLVWDPDYWYAQWVLLSCEQLGNREELTVEFSHEMGFVPPSPDARASYFMYKVLHARWTAAKDLCCDKNCECCNSLIN